MVIRQTAWKKDAKKLQTHTRKWGEQGSARFARAKAICSADMAGGW